ncbi:MAG: YggT family protein [Spirochaetia bacterium]
MLVALSILNIILIAYLFILSLRIVLGWFAPQALGRAWDVFTALTDPYLGMFSRIRFLRGNLFDFSPIAAILALVVALDLVNRLLDDGRVMLGSFLASVVSAAWFGISFLLAFFLIVGLLRTIPLAFRSAAGASIWKVVDTIMQPVVAWVMKVFRLGRRSGYTQHLLLTIGLLFVAWLLGELLVHGIVSLFQRLPF